MAPAAGILTIFVFLVSPSLIQREEPPQVTIESHADYLDFRIGKDPVTQYHFAKSVAKPYFWPVFGPGGVSMTRAWPMEKAGPGGSNDHPHQKSIWFCHGDVVPEGIAIEKKIRGLDGIDFWAEARGHGRIVCTMVGDSKQEEKHGWIQTQNQWQTAEGVPILEEVRTLHLYDIGESRLLVVEIDMEAKYGGITFGDTKEGSFGIRVNDLIREEKGNGRIENADGKIGEKYCWGRVSAWCDYSGAIKGQTVGMAILADPANPYPSCWHVRGYGLMAANPFGRANSGFPDMKEKTDLARIAKHKHLKLRYGILIHPGNAKEGKVSENFDRFVKLNSAGEKGP
jgi:hypothetical protein